MPNKLAINRIYREHAIIAVIENQNTSLTDPALKYGAANWPFVFVNPTLAAGFALKRHQAASASPNKNSVLFHQGG